MNHAMPLYMHFPSKSIVKNMRPVSLATVAIPGRSVYNSTGYSYPGEKGAEGLRIKKGALRLLTVLLALCLCAGGAAESFVRTVLTDSELLLRSGPGNGYEVLGSFSAGGQELSIYSRYYDAGSGAWWVQVEFAGGGKRLRGYTEAWRFGALDLSSVRTEAPLSTCVTPGYPQDGYCGPGYDYRRVSVPANAQCLICDAVNDFLQLEFYDPSQGCSRRVWLLEPFVEEAWADGGSRY